MNTTHSIFNNRQINYRILGGNAFNANAKLSIGVLVISTCGNPYKNSVFENLLKCGFGQIISLEKYGENFCILNYSKKFPSIKFIEPLQDVTIGERINIGMKEISSDYVLVINDNITVKQNSINEKIVARIREKNQLCLVPTFLYGNIDINVIPVQVSPTVENKILKFDTSLEISEGTKSVYPFNFIGIYNRNKFILNGGFDYKIKSAYWQNVDFFMRSWLWGDECSLYPNIKLLYDGEILLEDMTIGKSYLRFYLKNILPIRKNGKVYIPITKFFRYFARSRMFITEAISSFNEARHFVKENNIRFKMDIEEFISNWKNK